MCIMYIKLLWAGLNQYKQNLYTTITSHNFSISPHLKNSLWPLPIQIPFDLQSSQSASHYLAEENTPYLHFPCFTT